MTEPLTERVMVLRASGESETHYVPRTNGYLATIRALIGADTLHIVSIGRGYVLAVDDAGHARGLPLNQIATDLYHVTGGHPDFPVLGDVVIMPA